MYFTSVEVTIFVVTPSIRMELYSLGQQDIYYQQNKK
jgi:hypothetical protein